MALSKRVMALSAVVVGTSAAVVAPAAPASAHEVTLSRAGAWATVGPAHSGIRVCNFDDHWPGAYAVYKGPQRSGNVQTGHNSCNDVVVPGGIQVFRLCLNDHDISHTCTDWKTVT